MAKFWGKELKENISYYFVLRTSISHNTKNGHNLPSKFIQKTQKILTGNTDFFLKDNEEKMIGKDRHGAFRLKKRLDSSFRLKKKRFFLSDLIDLMEKKTKKNEILLDKRESAFRL